MKPRIFTSLVVVAAAFVGALVCPSAAHGQTKVALIDIGQVFKNHPSFSQQLANLKTEADQFKMQSDQVRQQMVKKAEELGLYQIGSPEYRNLESKLAQEAAAIDVEQKNKLRTLMASEARLHFDTYQQVTNIIRDYCQKRNIQLVLRYNSQQMDPGVPQSIMDKVNGSVVYYEPGKDVTGDIIQMIQQVSASAPQHNPARR